MSGSGIFDDEHRLLGEWNSVLKGGRKGCRAVKMAVEVGRLVMDGSNYPIPRVERSRKARENSAINHDQTRTG